MEWGEIVAQLGGVAGILAIIGLIVDKSISYIRQRRQQEREFLLDSEENEIKRLHADIQLESEEEETRLAFWDRAFQENQALHNRLYTLEERIGEMEQQHINEILDLKKEYSGQVAALQEELYSVREELSLVKERLESREERINELEKTEKIQSEGMRNLERENKQLKEESKQLKEENRRLTHRVKELENKLARLETNNGG